MFAGRSSLRSTDAAAPLPVNQKLQDYLSKYTADGDGKAKKRKKPKAKQVTYSGVCVVDQDVTGFAANVADYDEDDGDAECAISYCKGLCALTATHIFVWHEMHIDFTDQRGTRLCTAESFD